VFTCRSDAVWSRPTATAGICDCDRPVAFDRPLQHHQVKSSSLSCSNRQQLMTCARLRDDGQLYTSVQLHRLIGLLLLQSVTTCGSSLRDRSSDVDAWMRATRRHLNLQKTQLIRLSYRQQLDKLIIAVRRRHLGAVYFAVRQQSTVGEHGVTLDSQMTLLDHVTNVCSA